MAQVQQWFAAVDTDRSGKISVEELQRALALGKLPFSLSVCAQMIRLYDKSNTGSLNFNDFSQLHAFLTQMQQSFSHFDADRSGELNTNEVFNSLTHAGFKLDQPAFYAMLKSFDPDRNGQLGLPEFIAMTLFLRSATATFQAFDQQRTGRINLDYNQFIYACANTR